MTAHLYSKTKGSSPDDTGANHRLWIAWPFALAGLIFTVISFNSVLEKEHRLAAVWFDREAMEGVNAIQKYLTHSIDAVRSLKALYAASQHVDREEFRSFSHNMLQAYPAILAIEWLPRITHTNRAQTEADLAALGVGAGRFLELDTDGQLVTAAPRDEYFPVFYSEPSEANAEVLGFNHAGAPTRLTTMRHARDTGQPAATHWVSLFRLEDDSHRRAGLLVFIAVYDNSVSPQTVEDRREHLIGYLCCVLSLKNIVDTAITPLDAKKIDYYLYEPPTGGSTAPQLLYAHASDHSSKLHEPGTPQDRLPDQSPDEISHQATISIGEQSYGVAYAPSVAYQAWGTDVPPVIVPPIRSGWSCVSAGA